ncbi:multidrug effflux MFS transporter [Saccharospirillum salsuginis]|uniref:Bcr/CflA family efflux transporter n=1 Tax=Saccharospirillum salsuginis TaxID=418750 RepID=A0A918KVS8_9GAMM|nr:multidrug effflux MFS transporter [Saccharospirillum salsuginis]GGX75852.1 MFS transporter [Saccharospirillum salsuginis]
MNTSARPADAPKPALRLPEFVALMALMVAQLALSVDAMLPALPDIASDLGVTDLARTQMIISFLILGMAIGQLFYGPLSDAIGRKPAILSGLACFVLGAVISMQAETLTVMLIGRLIQGFGVSAPRIVSVALIRDQYIGRAMAQVMSFIMMVFILVPMLAPAVGQLILRFAGWRAIFGIFIGLAIIVGVWFGVRQPETLTRSKRHPFSWIRLWSSTVVVVTTPTAMWFTAATGFIMGAFLTYLSTSQAIFQDVYGVGDRFPLYFALLASAIGLASFTNSRLVMRFGTRRITYVAVSTFITAFAVLLLLALAQGGTPAFGLFMGLGAVGFFGVGLLFGNLNAMAMQPLGQVAGLGAALVGSIGNFMAVPLSLLVGQFYNATPVPMLVAFVVYGGLALACMRQGMATHVDE